MNISDEAVEAGKLGLLRYYGCRELPPDVEDDDLHEGGKLVAEILEAAAPHLMADAWDACANSLVYEDGSKVEIAGNTNPYRDAGAGE